MITPVTTPASTAKSPATIKMNGPRMPWPMPRPTATPVIEPGVAFLVASRYRPGWSMVKDMAA